MQVLLAGDAIDEAVAATDELDGIATAFGSGAMRAMADQARGSTLLAAGDPGAAVPALRRALRVWRDLEVPYEAARARVLVGRALRELGDADTATGELTAALRTFTELGAAPAARETTALLGPEHPAGLTAREGEVLRLVARGPSNTEIAAALVISEKTVARHLSNIFTKLDVGSRTAAAAYAFENRLV